jgi:hypothetical protein
MEPPPSPLPWKVDGLLILAADGTVVASVATHAPVCLAATEGERGSDRGGGEPRPRAGQGGEIVIRVVNVSGMNRAEDRARVVYVGRAFAGWKPHPLANPFRPANVDGRAVLTCLERYERYLRDRPTLEADLSRLWEETDRGFMPLGCWCVDAVHGDGQAECCHAQILARMLAERFDNPLADTVFERADNW